MRKASVGGQGLCTLLQRRFQPFRFSTMAWGLNPYLAEAILNRQHKGTMPHNRIEGSPIDARSKLLVAQIV